MSTIFKEVARDGVEVTQASDLAANASHGGRIRLQADVVVVGSGTGGSVVAYELAKTGKSVVVLEAGPYVPSSQFNENFSDSLSRLYVSQGAQTNMWGDLIALQGSCVGGSSVISGTVSQRIPEWVLKQWRDEYGLKDMTDAALKPHYEKIEKLLHVHENEPHEINECAQKVVQGCERLGFDWSPVHRNVKQCALTGFCVAGCPSDRKMSAIVTYLPWAVAEGARIYADTHVLRVRTLDGRAVGVDAEVIDPQSGRKVADLRVDSQVVVLAAGAVQTPQILQRSGYPDYGDQVGRNYAGHPMVQVVGKFPEPVYGWRGAFIGVSVEEFLPPSKGSLYFHSGLSGPEQVLTANEHGSGKDHLEFMRDFRYYSALNAFARDANHGRVRWVDKGNGKGVQRIEWQLSREDVENLKRATGIAARIYFAAGAQKVYLPTFEKLVAHDVFELDKLIGQVDYAVAGMYSFRVLALSSQGTARMGDNPEYSVVNPNGEAHEVTGLFVADASLLPSNPGVYPQMIISVLADRVAAHINANESTYFV